MSWASTFMGLGYRERAEFLRHFLEQRPNGLTQRNITDPFTRGYKDVLSYIVGGFCLRSEYRYISEGAQERFENTKERLKNDKTYKNKIDDKPVYNHVYRKGRYQEYEGLTHEHTVSKGLVVEHLVSLNKAQLTVDYLEDFIEKVSGIALITDEENNALDGNGLRKKLPSGITLDDILQGKAPHSARYDAAGIKMAETNHQAKA